MLNDKVKKEIKDILEESTELSTPIYTLEDMRVEMIDYPHNCYQMMFLMSTQTWGQDPWKWDKCSPETRFEVVKMILQKKALPLSVEHPVFGFQVEHVSRALFDQIARTRVGFVCSSRGQKDDSLEQLGFVLNSKIQGKIRDEVLELVTKSKELYKKLTTEYKLPNWACRGVLSMYSDHGFAFSANFLSIQGMLSKRLETSEMEECIAFGILVREAIKEKFPLLAEYLYPSCDSVKRDLNMVFNGFSDIVGIPHISDKRWATDEEIEKQKLIAKHPEPCTDIEVVEKMIGKHLPLPSEKIDYTWDTLEQIDKDKFNEPIHK